jgi:malonate transporter and related proteins
MLLIIINALTPVAFVILLGWLAGRSGIVAASASSELAVLVLDFCLPAELFIGTASATPSQLDDWRFFVAIAIGLLAIYLLALAVALLVFRHRVDASALQALNGAFPNMAFMGIPVLTAVIGPSAVLPVVIGNLVSSLVLLPLTLALLEAGKSGGRGHQGLIVVWHSVLGSIRQPLVIAPVLGVVVALSAWHLPVALHNSFTLLGSATSGVALFALGLLLTGETLKLSFSAVLNTVTKNLVQPLAIWLLVLLLDMPGEYRRELILLGALPTATITTMLALRYKVYTSESNATVLLSTVLSIVTLGAVIALTQ